MRHLDPHTIGPPLSANPESATEVRNIRKWFNFLHIKDKGVTPFYSARTNCARSSSFGGGTSSYRVTLQ